MPSIAGDEGSRAGQLLISLNKYGNDPQIGVLSYHHRQRLCPRRRWL